MNEVKHIHIGRQQFTVSTEAYGELRQYLEAIARSAGQADGDVTEEVELRMAELLTERGVTAEKVVLPADVAYLKAQLGEPSDFADTDAASADKPQSTAPRRLFRDPAGAMVAGVASGLAKYLGIDVTAIRLLFVLSILLGGSGILVYVLLWLLVPEATTASERLSMQGKPATVENLKQVVERADVPAAARRSRTLALQLLRPLGRVLLFIIGLPLAIGAGMGLVWTVIVSIYFLFNGAKVAGQVVAPIGSHEVTAFVAAVVALVVVLLSLTLIGIAMIRRRWQLPAWGVATLVGLFVVASSVGGAFAADAVPHIRDRVNGLHHATTVSQPSFSRADLSGHDTRFVFVPDSRTFVRYRYFGSVDVHQLHASVKNGTLTVRTDGLKGSSNCNLFCVYSGPDLQVELHAPRLDDVHVTGDRTDFLSAYRLSQPAMSLTVADNVLVSLTHAYPATAELHDSNSGDRHLSLTFGGGAQTDDGVSINPGDAGGTVSFTRVGSLNVINDRACDQADPFIFVLNGVQQLALNGKSVPASQQGYNSLRSSASNNLFNCLVLQAEPQLPDAPVTPAWHA